MASEKICDRYLCEFVEYTISGSRCILDLNDPSPDCDDCPTKDCCHCCVPGCKKSGMYIQDDLLFGNTGEKI